MSEIRTTHVGSLPRPTEMITRQLKKEEIPASDIAAYVEEIVSRQRSTGLSVINNGELPRADYIASTVGRIAGFGDATGIAPAPQDMEEVPEYSRRFSGRNALITLNPKAPVKLPVCDDALAYRGEETLAAEIEMLTEAFERQGGKAETELFFTAPSPGTIALFFENHHYQTDTAYLEALGEALHHEYEAIAKAGVLLQVDCPDLAMGRHTAYKGLSEEEFLKLADANVSVLNSALDGIDASRIRAHVCWGNYPGTHHCDIELHAILPVISQMKPRFISIESCNHRHAHELETLAEIGLPDDKVVMPGVIDTNSNTVEHPDFVKQRLMVLARRFGAERVMGSTDCGFASTGAAASVSGEVAWLKLESLVEGARRASEEL